jgi:two-component system cell cycle response regulator
MHAVIVDSSRVVLKLIAQHFAARGDTASTFTDSQKALQKVLADRTVDIVLTSLEVSPIAGLELCWQCRLAANRHRPIYIAVMSSTGDDDNITQALDCGADDLILKPVSRQLLYARLRTVSRLHNAQLDLVRLAETDALTGVLNRRAFFEQANALLSDPAVAPVSAVMLDIDHFKGINDTFGHDSGDRVIQGVAREAATSPGALIGRLGGEEFALLLPGRGEAEAYALADALRWRCGELMFKSLQQHFRITCSLGVSERTPDDTPDTLLRRADIALYQAKTGGRNQVRIADRHMSEMPRPAQNISVRR